MRWKKLVLMAEVCIVAGVLMMSAGHADGAMLSISYDITVVGSTKTYTYTIRNDNQPYLPTNDFTLYMPEAGARAVISCTASDPTWTSASSFGGDNSFWEISGNELLTGQTIQMQFTTLASVPTTYTFAMPNWGNQLTTNWSYNIVSEHSDTPPGDTILPVPGVPEPSSVAALACGLVALGGLIRRRKKD